MTHRVWGRDSRSREKKIDNCFYQTPVLFVFVFAMRRPSEARTPTLLRDAHGVRAACGWRRVGATRLFVASGRCGWRDGLRACGRPSSCWTNCMLPTSPYVRALVFQVMRVLFKLSLSHDSKDIQKSSILHGLRLQLQIQRCCRPETISSSIALDEGTK